jgi:hypothetical protein
MASTLEVEILRAARFRPVVAIEPTFTLVLGLYLHFGRSERDLWAGNSAIPGVVALFNRDHSRFICNGDRFSGAASRNAISLIQRQLGEKVEAVAGETGR